MRIFPLAIALTLAAWSLALVPAASAIQEPPTCIRQGPPCGPEPIEFPCIVDSYNSDCIVSIETYVCVTDPCPGIIICVLHGRHCLVP